MGKMNVFLTLIFSLLLGLLTACQPSGDAESSFGSKVPTNDELPTTGGGSGGASIANLVSKVNGDKQNVAVGGTASLPLVVLVLQAPGQPVANETVHFQVVGGASNGTVSAASATTNASGYAEVYFTGGSVIGDVNVVASAPQGSVNFTMTVTGATGYNLDFAPIGSGEGQVGNINSSLASKFKVVLTNQHGTPVSGQNVRFVSVGGIQGNFSGATYYDSMTNATGVAESEILTLSSTAGHHSINAYLIGDSSVNIVFGATSVTPTNSVIDPIKSKLTLSSGMVAADGMNTVEATIEVRDIYDNLIPNSTYAGLISVTGTPALMYGSTWIGSWTYSSTGTYKRTILVGNTSGDINFSASVNSVALLSSMPTLRLTANSTVDNSKTTIASTINPLSADGVSTTTIVVQLRDTFNNPIDLPGQSIVVTTSLGTLVGSMTYHAATGTYRQLLIAPTSVGAGSLTVTLQTINGVAVPGVTYNLPLQAATISAVNSSISITDRIFTANSQVKTITLSLKDLNNNGITAPATITMNKMIQSGALTGTFANSGVVTSVGSGVYQINLTSPSNTTTCSGVAVICTEDISATVTVGATTITLGPIRVQYKGAAMTPSAAHSYLVMNSSSVSVGTGNVLTGTIYLRTATPDQYSVGGNQSLITLEFTGCNPTYSITDNNSGTYTVTINSPSSSCSGSMSVKYGSTPTLIGTSSAPGTASANPFNFTFYGALSLGQSVLTISPAIVSGSGSTTASLEVKDDGGNNYPTCTISTALIRFQENHADTAPTGVVSCSVVGGKAIYSQSIERSGSPDEYGTVNISAQYNNAGWNSFASMKTLQLTPPNLAGYTIDCDNEGSFRDKNIYVKDGTLTINGWINGSIPTLNNCSPGNPIRFKTLRVGPNGVVTHTRASTTQAFGIDVYATESITVEASGKIDVIGKGYQGANSVNASLLGRGPGNVEMNPGAASYGGLGVAWHTRDTNSGTNRQAIYGTPSDPNDVGSGAGRHGWHGALNTVTWQGTDGGGLVRLKSPAMLINGSILADGMIGASAAGAYGMAGSGGGIKLDLNGTGVLQGSGLISATGGRITGLDSYGGGGRIAILGDMSPWTGPTPNVLGGLNNPAVTENGYGSSLNHGTLYISKVPATYSIPFSMIIGPSDSYLGGATNITVPTGYTVTLATDVNWANLLVNGTLNFKSGKVISTNVTVSSSGSVTHEALTTINGSPKVHIVASGTITIDSGAVLNASTKGYYASGNNGYGNAWAVNATAINWHESCQGGNHYTRGGGTAPAIGPTTNPSGVQWGVPAEPDSYGGAGCRGDRGGGIVRLIADTINLNGSIIANAGGAAVAGHAGSAGGSIYLEANTLNAGAGNLLQAKGGSTGAWGAAGHYAVGGGAGGLIGVKYHTLNGTVNTDVTGGMNWNGAGNTLVKYSEDGVVTFTNF